jgi:hypothetical protein
LFKNKIIFKFIIFLATKYGWTKTFSPSSFGAFVGSESRDPDRGSGINIPDPQHCHSPTEKGGSKNKDHDDKNELVLFVWCIDVPSSIASMSILPVMEECRRLLSMKALDTSSLLTFLLGAAPDPSSLLGAPAPPVDLPDRLSLKSDRKIRFL